VTSPFTTAEVAIARRAYARQVLVAAGAQGNGALEDAFATVRREAFLGPAPWTARIDGGYRRLDDTDPVLVYQDVLFALAPDRGVNNGMPSLHARRRCRAPRRRCRPGLCQLQRRAAGRALAGQAAARRQGALFPPGVPGTQRTPSGARHAVRGAGLLVTRRPGGYAAESLGPAFFVCAEGSMTVPARRKSMRSMRAARSGRMNWSSGE
jgi:hypothetical protein